MAHLIMVHGVATRSGPSLDQAEKTMGTLFARTVFPGLPLIFQTPRWGDFVPAVAPSVYETDEEEDAFAIGAEPAPESAEGGPSVGGQASVDPQAALDAILVTVVQTAEAEGRDLTDEELQLFERAVEVIDDREKASELVGGGGSDDALVTALDPGEGSLSVGSFLKDAIDRVTGRLRQVASAPVTALVRAVRPAIGLFIGDVFAYLDKGDLRGKIQGSIRTALLKAWTERAAGEPLILVGHSMGGVILVDMLSDPIDAGLPADFKVDLLVTVGSQGGLFKAVGVLRGPPPGTARIAKPVGAKAWLNVFDPIDPLAFTAEPIFLDVTDLTFDSVTGVASAHTTYFKRPQFYARLRKRLIKLKLIA